MTEQLRLHDPQEPTIKQEDETESKDSIILSQGDLDAIKMLDLDLNFDSPQLMMPFGVDTEDLDIDKFKVEDEVQQQQQQTATTTTATASTTTSAAAPNYTFNEQMLNSPQTKMAHKIKVRNLQTKICSLFKQDSFPQEPRSIYDLHMSSTCSI